MAGRYQVHEHSILSSRRSPGETIVHAHDGSERPHRHPDCGPAFYGHLGAKDTFSAKPKGEQRPLVALEDGENSFEIVVCDPPASYIGEGPGLLPAQVMMRGFKMRVSRIVDGRRRFTKGRSA